MWDRSDLQPTESWNDDDSEDNIGSHPSTHAASTPAVPIATLWASTPQQPGTPRTVLTANLIALSPATWVGELGVPSVPLPVR